MNKTVKAALAAAVEEDHPCEDPGCDIAVSLREGFAGVAAFLLTGATETPAVDAVCERYDVDLSEVFHGRQFSRWVAFHYRYGRKCELCDSYTYGNPATGYEPQTCANCLAPLGERQLAWNL